MLREREEEVGLYLFRRGVLYFCIATAIAVVPLLVAGFFIPPLAGLLWSIAVGIIVSTFAFMWGVVWGSRKWALGGALGGGCVLLILIILLVAGFFIPPLAGLLWSIAVGIIVFFWITFSCSERFYSWLDEWIEEKTKYDEVEEWVEEERLKKKRK